MTVEDKQGMLTIWQELFSDDDVNLVKAAVKQLILTREYPPQINHIKSAMYEICNPKTQNVLEAWNITKKAIRHNKQLANIEYSKLPLEIQRTLRNPDTLVEWAMVDRERLETIVYARFRDMYNQTLSEIKMAVIAPNRLIQSTEQMKIGGEFNE